MAVHTSFLFFLLTFGLFLRNPDRGLMTLREMPVLDGFEATAEIRRRETRQAASLASASSEAAVDPAVLASLKGMAAATDPELFEQIVQSFLADSRQGITELRRASAADAASLRRTAHAIKGMCASIGADKMRGICQELEALGAAGSLLGAPALIDRVANEFQRAESELSPHHEVAAP